MKNLSGLIDIFFICDFEFPADCHQILLVVWPMELLDQLQYEV